MIEESVEFRAHKDHWELHFVLTNDLLILHLHSELTLETFQGDVTPAKIQEDKNLSFFFEGPRELFKFLEASYNELTILGDGTIVFVMGMPVGRMVKNIEFRIPTLKQELDQGLLLDRKFKAMERNVDVLREESEQLKAKVASQEVTVDSLKEEVSALQRALAQKDEVLNSIFSELGELTKWREEKEKEGSRRRFQPDELNPHSGKFICTGNRFRKMSGGSWDLLLCRHQIERNEIYRYTLRQIRAGNNGSFMYGIGTTALRGLNRAQDHREFIGYYENTGNIYDKGESKKGGPKIKDGEVMTVEVDTRSWKIAWLVEGVKEAECAILGELRSKPIFLAIVVFNQDSEIEFL